MTERRRFTTTKYDSIAGGYNVLDRSARVATFVDQGLAVAFCKMLRLFPGMTNSYRNLTQQELDEVEELE